MREPWRPLRVVEHFDSADPRAVYFAEARKHNKEENGSNKKPREDVDDGDEVENDEDAVLNQSLHHERKTNIGYRGRNKTR